MKHGAKVKKRGRVVNSMPRRKAATDVRLGIHRPPDVLLRDAIERSLGWSSEGSLLPLVEEYTGVRLSLGQANRFSQAVADIVVSRLGLSDMTETFTELFRLQREIESLRRVLTRRRRRKAKVSTTRSKTRSG